MNMMSYSRRLPLVVVGTAGLVVGLVLGSLRPIRPVFASGNDRWGERILATGPVAIEQIGQQIQVNHDAIYYLNYHTGRLLATIPSMKQTGLTKQMLSEFAERDLVRDFELGPGVAPHFLMTTGGLGFRSEGWAPLYVFETETGQVAIYRLAAQSVAGVNKPAFQLLERKVDRRLGRAVAAAASTGS